MEQDLDALTSGELGRDAAVAVGEGHGGLRLQAGRSSQSRGLVGSVNHDDSLIDRLIELSTDGRLSRSKVGWI
jgi:hypothetical protein